MEERRQQLERSLAQDGADMAKLSVELADLIQTIESAEERWLELSELRPDEDPALDGAFVQQKHQNRRCLSELSGKDGNSLIAPKHRPIPLLCAVDRTTLHEIHRRAHPEGSIRD